MQQFASIFKYVEAVQVESQKAIHDHLSKGSFCEKRLKDVSTYVDLEIFGRKMIDFSFTFVLGEYLTIWSPA